MRRLVVLGCLTAALAALFGALSVEAREGLLRALELVSSIR